MAFQRMEGYAGSIPQGFIDRSVKVCPLCGTGNPHWSIDHKMQLKLEGNLYLFQCEQCGCILSSPVPDVTGFNNTMLTTTGLLKKFSGKQNSVIYMKVQNAGTSGITDCVGQEYTLQELNQMASERYSGESSERKFY